MLPYFQEEVRGVNLIRIQDIFTTSASACKFQIIEKTPNSSIAVYQESYSLKSIISCCIPGSLISSTITSVKFEALVDEFSSLLIVRSLSGDPFLSTQVVNEFKSRLHHFLQSPQVSNFFFSKSFQAENDSYIGPPKATLKVLLPTKPSEIYMILASPEDIYNKRISHFLEEVKANITYQPLDRIRLETEILSRSLLSQYSALGFTLNYCAQAIESVIFPKIYSDLLNIYKEKSQVIDGKFAKHQKRLKTLNTHKLLNTLQVSQNFQLTDCPDPYSEAKTVLSRLNKMKTPIDKVNCLINTVACMKSCVVDYWKGALEIQAMDDELPILMFLLLTSKLESPYAELEILKEYLGENMENEYRIIVNFNSAITYLALYFESEYKKCQSD